MLTRMLKTMIADQTDVSEGKVFNQNYINNKQQQIEMIKYHKKSEFFIIIQKK